MSSTNPRTDDLAHQLEATQVLALLIAIAQQRLHQNGVFTLTQCFNIQSQVKVKRADMRHFLVTQQQPVHGTADDGDISPAAAQELAERNENLLDRS